jgi:hypothetical protein
MNGDLFPEVVPAEDPNRRYTTAAFMEWIKKKAGVTEWDVDVAADAESHWAKRWFSVCPYPGSSGVNGLVQSWLPPRPPPFKDTCQTRPHGNYDHCARGDGVLCAEDECDIDDGLLSRPWRIYCNPPFDDLESWIVKAWATIRAADQIGLVPRIGFVLPGNRHEQPFWQEHIEPFRDGRGRLDGYTIDLHFPPARQAYAKPGSNGVAVGSADFPSALLVFRHSSTLCGK